MGDLTQFIAVPIDLTEQGLVAGEAFKCASPQAAIERAKGVLEGVRPCRRSRVRPHRFSGNDHDRAALLRQRAGGVGDLAAGGDQNAGRAMCHWGEPAAPLVSPGALSCCEV